MCWKEGVNAGLGGRGGEGSEGRRGERGVGGEEGKGGGGGGDQKKRFFVGPRMSLEKLIGRTCGGEKPLLMGQGG